MLDTKLKVLAIDYGTKRIGLAISFGSLADPLTIISNDQNAIAYICKIVDDYKIGKIIIGLSENETAEKTRIFTEMLQRSLTIPIELFDETLSTKVVRNKLEEAHKSQKRRVDHLAAAEFLQEWLDTTN
jgi:putative transcription antitermination factor YqgF